MCNIVLPCFNLKTGLNVVCILKSIFKSLLCHNVTYQFLLLKSPSLFLGESYDVWCFESFDDVCGMNIPNELIYYWLLIALYYYWLLKCCFNFKRLKKLPCNKCTAFYTSINLLSNSLWMRRMWNTIKYSCTMDDLIFICNNLYFSATATTIKVYHCLNTGI